MGSIKSVFHSGPLARKARGTALVLVLLVLFLLTGIVVVILSQATTERVSSSLSLQRAQAEIFADAAADHVMGTISDAVTQGSQAHKSWASEPGRIWICSIDAGTGAMSWKSIDLISALPKADPDNVDLNTPSYSGEFPIAPPAPGQTAANMKVGWVNLLRDPSSPASKSNPIAGRVAYWVDDESCKVNVNTADGSQRTNATPTAATIAGMAASGTYSFGFGAPSEISLAALPGLDQTKAAAIAAYPWKQEFNSADEITRVTVGGTQAVNRSMCQALRFDITHYNSSPDLNFMGEPRLNLIEPVDASSTTPVTPRQNASLGPYVRSATVTGVANLAGSVLDHIYPQPSQLPRPPYLPAGKFFLHAFSQGPGAAGGQRVNTANYDYYVGQIITSYLSGINLQGQSFSWPKFDGASTSRFTDKYTPRQLDSLTLQILDTVGKVALADQYRSYSLPSIMPSGWLSNQIVMGIGRAPKLTEILIQATVTNDDLFGYGTSSPSLQLSIISELYFPLGFRGAPLNLPYDQGAVWQFSQYPYGKNILNFYDNPVVSSSGVVSGSSSFGTVWMDSTLTVLDQNGNSAGIDMMGASSLTLDPDQTRAKTEHPFCAVASGSSVLSTSGSTTSSSGHIIYSGSVIPPGGAGSRTWGFLESAYMCPLTAERPPGSYIAVSNRYPTMKHPGKIGTTSMRLTGGLLYAGQFGIGAPYNCPIIAPLDAMAPEILGTTLSGTTIAQIKAAMIPVDLSIPLSSGAGRRKLLLRTRDPLVNQFPGDWEAIVDPVASDITLNVTSVWSTYMKGGIADLDPSFPPDASVTARPSNLDGDNPGFKASGQGDPLSVWLPIQDARLPKLARFPSVGALFSVRTGLFPDKGLTSLPQVQQHGVPFRCLNMAPSTQPSQATLGGLSYPDWAMLDLFTVPFLPQKPYMVGDAAQPVRRLTYGGATVGRMNINNPVTPYPFSVATAGVAQTPPKRNALKALFQGLTPSRNYDINNAPVFETIDAATAATLAQAVSDYQQSHGPFLMTGEIANVSAVAGYAYGGVAAEAVSRNDVVRDTVGAATTRSNVFSVWVVAQTVKKVPSNTNYGEFENRDVVTSEVRRRYVIERYMETGKDGVPGNAVSPGVGGVANAYTAAKPNGDDTDATYHPSLSYPLPYRWRVVAVENVQQ